MPPVGRLVRRRGRIDDALALNPRPEDHRVGRVLDACDRGLAARPDDVDLHLLIAELRLERGALGPAGDTYRRLLRLVDIDGDAATHERVLAAARQAFPDDPGFAPTA